jgi:hypothetical protein
LRQLGHWPIVAPCHGSRDGSRQVTDRHHQDQVNVWGASRANARRLITTTATATRSTWLRPDGGGAGGSEFVYLWRLWGFRSLPIASFGPGIDRASINRMGAGYGSHRHASFKVLLNFGPLAGCMLVGGWPGGALASHFLCHGPGECGDSLRVPYTPGSPPRRSPTP